MKRIVTCLLITAFCSLALCGCGARDERLDEMVVGTPVVPETTPMVTPMPMPDTDEGVVRDGDGLIEDEDTGDITTPEASMRPNTAAGADRRTGNATPSSASPANP